MSEVLLGEFDKCLCTISHYRAGSDYEISPAYVADEKKSADRALVMARAIWTENPALHDELRRIWSEAKPLMTFDEVAQP